MQNGAQHEARRMWDLQASWDSASSSYTEQRLREIFLAHGGVEDVILRKPKRKGRHSALIVMRDLQVACIPSGINHQDPRPPPH